MLRGLRLLEEQETNPKLKRVIREIGAVIETGESLSDAFAHHPKLFNRLYINMVKAGEIGGVVDITLKRLADFMEKADKIKSKVKTAMFYPAAVITVAVLIMGILLVFVIPKFKTVFAGLLPGTAMPRFTTIVLNISEAVKNHTLLMLGVLATVALLFKMVIGTKAGRRLFDAFKLKMPVLGPIVRKVAIARFARTFGTLVSSGVPMLQTLSILEETTGNVVVSRAVNDIHESVKNGETIAAPLKASGIFPSMVVGMIDVGEQTGALPEMLGKVADTYDEQVDTAVSGLTSLLEPIMIVFLAILVGSIVAALFLPLITIIENIGNEDRSNA